MKVLVVCSRRRYSPHTDYMAPFVYEQMNAIQALGIECRAILVDKGRNGYSRALKEIKKAIHEFSPDIVHAHYGLCGLIANLQRKVPVVTTYHGTDLHDKRLRRVSQLSVVLSKRNIVVSKALSDNLLKQKSIRVIPCGVNADLLIPLEKDSARMELGWDISKKYILFSKEFYNPAKNYPLAKAAVDEYNSKYSNGSDAELLEFIGYTREQVLLLYNAVDCVLMTSDHEGYVKHVIAGTEGCYIAERNPDDIARKIDLAIKQGKTSGRERVLQEFDSRVVARKVVNVYNEVISYE